MTNSTPPAGTTGGFDEELELLAQLLGDEDATQGGAITARPRGGAMPTSFAQELLWLLDRATPGLTAYNMTIARRLTGPLDVNALRSALDVLVARHEALRTRFGALDGSAAPVQLVDPPSPAAKAP